jgi:hypothetical protein
MDEERLRKFANQLDADTDEVVDRWQGRPDRIMDDLFRIADLDTGEVRDLELFDVQRKFVHAYFYSDASTLNAYKGRRIGYSFVAVACFLLEALFYKNSFYPLVSRSWSQAKNRIEDIDRLIENAKIEIPTKKRNSDYIELWNGSSFMAYSADADTSRGDDSARAVLLDEMAFIENQKETMRAFDAFLALGEGRKMVEVSTPNTKNDLFMQEHRRGSRDGENGVVSIKQPTFLNADEIDVNKPLTEQEVVPARPEIDVDRLEGTRMADPEGFGQEYLCRPVVDEYRFFDEDSIRTAQERASAEDYRVGMAAPKENMRRVMGVDIGISQDDTVVSVVDHHAENRFQRLLAVVDDGWLRDAGVADPDRGNPNHIARLVGYIHSAMDVDLVVIDKGGPGEGFARTIDREIGRGVVPFDFSDRDEFASMMGDTNACLREENAALVPNDRLFDELSSIVKEKKKEHSKPSFSGKENSETGKDDTAMATVLSMFPPNNSATEPGAASKRQRQPVETPKEPSRHRGKPKGQYNPSHGATSVNRSSRTRTNRYQNRRTRTPRN